MKSRTSFFNWTVFKKDITRFAPAWGLYLVGMVLAMLSSVSGYQPIQALWDMESWIMAMAVVNLGYGLIVAQLIFGDLFNTRLCNALHAMPLRREGWFFTHLASGLCFSIVPNLLAALLMLPRLDWYWMAAFLWLGAAILQYLFFFAVGVFCVMCTGNRFAMAVIYGLINFGSLVAWWFVDTIYEPLLYGIEIDSQVFFDWCPVVRLCRDGWFNCDEDIAWAVYSWGENWPYLLGLGVLAAVLLAVSVLLYRRRKLESAGDFVAVRPLGPIFLVVYTLTAAAVFAWFDEVLFDSVEGVFLLVGLAVGYVTGHMLLKRTVRVFRWKMVLGGLGIGAALLASMLITWLDPIGATRWVPEAEKVESVSIGTYGYYYKGVSLTEFEDIEMLVDIHGEMVEQRPDGYAKLGLSYKMKDGSTAARNYYFDPKAYTQTVRELRSIMSRPEYVLGYEDWEEYIADVYMVEFFYNETHRLDGDEARSFLEAVKLDCEAGHMCQSWDYRDENTGSAGWVNLYRGGGYVGDITIFYDCRNAISWLEAHGVNLEEFK